MVNRKNKTQVNVRVSDTSAELLAALQEHFAEKAGLHTPISQSQVIEALIHQAAQEADLKKGRK